MEKTAEYKENLLKLENFVLAKWLQDTTIIPGPSAHFGFYLDGQVRYKWAMSSSLHVTSLQDILSQDLQDLALYTEDWLGLKTLDQQGKLHFREMEGDHMDFNWEWFTENVVLPFLV